MIGALCAVTFQKILNIATRSPSTPKMTNFLGLPLQGENAYVIEWFGESNWCCNYRLVSAVGDFHGSSSNDCCWICAGARLDPAFLQTPTRRSDSSYLSVWRLCCKRLSNTPLVQIPYPPPRRACSAARSILGCCLVLIQRDYLSVLTTDLLLILGLVVGAVFAFLQFVK